MHAPFSRFTDLEVFCNYVSVPIYIYSFKLISACFNVYMRLWDVEVHRVTAFDKVLSCRCDSEEIAKR